MKNIYPFALILILFIGNSFKSFSQCTTPTTTDGSRCGEGSVTVSAASLTGNYRWYDVASGGDIHGNSSSYNTPIISSNTTFYVSEFNNGTTNDALTFDGTNDYVAINDMHFQTQSLELITIEAWVKTTISGEGQWDNWSIVDFDRSEYFNMYVRGDNGYVGFSTTDNDSHTDDFNGTTAVNDGIWHHIVAVYDGTDKRIYVDGVLDATKVNPHGGLDLGTGITRYGYLGDGSESSSYNSSRNDFYYDGSIDEVRVWNTVRTATEITNNKDKCVPEGDEDLMLYYRMDGSGSDNTLIDYSGNNYNGKLYNMTLPGAWTTGGNLTDCPTCESSRATVVAEIKAAPVVDLGADKCINGVSVILDAGNAGTIDSYLWSEGAATTQTISVNSNGYYSVTVGHSTNSCETIDGVSVSLLSQPSGTDNDRCGDGEVDLEVNTPTSTEYNWYAASSGGNAIGTGVDFTSPSIAATTSYWVSQIDNSQYKEALHFDGVNDKVALDGFTYAGDSYTEMTVEAWIRTSDATDQIIASFDRSEYWRFEVNGTGAGSGQIGFDIFTNAGQLDFGGTTVISDGSWHHVAAVYDNGTVKIYIDGHLDATTTKGTAFGKGVGTVRYGYIGVGSEASSFNGSTAPNDYFNGAIDEVRIWNVARNITQIQNNMNNCLLGSETGLVSYYKMEDGSGSASLGDHTNNGNLGTLVNMDVNNAWINTGKNIECSCGESDREEVIATINAIPTVDFGLDRCEAATITLDAENAGGHTYLWQDGSTNQTLDAATSQQYWAHITSTATSCVGGDTVEISIGTTAKPTTTDGSRCGNGTVDLAVINVNTIKWYDLETGGTLLHTGLSYTTPSISSNTDYYVSSDEGTSCGESAREKITAIVNDNITTFTQTISWPGDNGTVIILSSAGGSGDFDYKELQGNFDYSGSFTSADVEKIIPNGGSYNIRVKDENGCEYTTNGITTKPKPNSIATVAHNSTSYFIPQKNEWYYITDASNKAIVAINSGSTNYLGDVSANLYIDGSTGVYDGYAFLKRHFVIDVENQPGINDVEVKLLFSTNEYNSLVSKAASTPEPLDDIASISDIGVTKYEGPTENGTYNPADNTSLAFIAQSANGSEAGGKFIIIQTNSFSEFWPHASGGGSALPIELISFKANKRNNNVVLSWATASELNNDYFTLERSVDGKEFTNLAKINGAGNSNIILNYQFTDTEPLSGVSYYRLKQTDFDGEFAYSDIIVINYTSDEEANVSIYPNPSNSIINIDLGGFVEDNIVEMNIYSMNGKLVANKQIAIDKNGNADISMNVKTILPSGIYFIMIIGNTSTVSHKIIIE